MCIRDRPKLVVLGDADPDEQPCHDQLMLEMCTVFGGPDGRAMTPAEGWRCIPWRCTVGGLNQSWPEPGTAACTHTAVPERQLAARYNKIL